MVSSSFILLGVSIVLQPTLLWCFISHANSPGRSNVILYAKKKDSGKGGGWLSNYKFGDISKSLVNNLTGKEEYEFGDLSRWLDQRAKSAVNELTGKDEYEFGDLSRFADSRIKEKLNSFTGKEEYQLGDVSKEILRRVASGDYKLEDIILLCKVLTSFGVGLAPVASALPAKLLLEMLNVSLAQEIGSRLLEALAVSVDQRVKETLTGDADYKMGDLTKRAILSFVGKDDSEGYEFGDITKTIAKRLEENADDGTKMDKFGAAKVQDSKGSVVLDAKLVAELEEWDRKRNASLENES